jgi:Flp pilus assembly protein TadG
MTHPDSRRTTARRRDERGSITVWMALASFAMIFLVGLAVDLGGQVHAHERVHDVAAQAARTGGEEVEGSTAIQGRSLAVSPAAARAAAQQYLDLAGVDGTVTITGGDTLTVTVHDTYDPRFLGLIGINHLEVTGTATARLIRTLGGSER